MRLAVISDIHGNSKALEATIYSAIENKCDGFIFLGDYGTDFVEIHYVLEMIRWCQKNYPTYVIKGNREDYILDYLDGKHPDWQNSPTKKAIILSAENMTQEDIYFIRNLSDCKIIDFDGGSKVILSHTLKLNKQYRDLIQDGKVKTLLFGHSHSSGSWHSSGCDIFNPGSIGLPDDGVSTYGILENIGNDFIFDIKSVSYDMTQEDQIIDNNPQLLGPNAAYHGEILKMSMRLGRNLNVDYLQECGRLSMIVRKAKENNSQPDLSPLKDYEKIFWQLKNASSDHNGIFLPFADFDFRKNFKLTRKMLVVPESSKINVEIIEKDFNNLSMDILTLAFSNIKYYYEQEMIKRIKKEYKKR